MFLKLKPQEIEDRPVNEGLRMARDQDFLVLRSLLRPGGSLHALGVITSNGFVVGCAGYRETITLTGRDLSSWLALPNFELVEQKFEAWRTQQGTRARACLFGTSSRQKSGARERHS